MKILDSDHCIAILRGRLDLAGHAGPAEPLAITAITVGELTHGAHRSARRADNLAEVETLVSQFQVLPFDDHAGRWFGEIKSELEGRGLVLADLDLAIASIALSQVGRLVTHNLRHFQRVPGLLLEDWLG